LLTIRFTRCGRSKLPFYRIVVTEKENPIKGKFNEMLGYYNPIANPKIPDIKVERLKYWIEKGAVPSPSCASLFKKQGLEGMDKFLTKPSKKGLKKKGQQETKDQQSVPEQIPTTAA